MQIKFQGSLFVQGPDSTELTAYANLAPACGVVLTHGKRDGLKELAKRVSSHRLLLPLTVSGPALMREQAEQLSLLGDNVYVQLPIMTAGHTNEQLICCLLEEGVALAITGVVTRQQVKRILDQANAETPLLIMMSAATSYYDLIVSTALAHIFPTVQLLVATPDRLAIHRAHRLMVDGIVVAPEQLTQVWHPNIGACCHLQASFN